jgi:hypothetical protein
MERFLALAAFLLSLLGCEPQRSVFESHAVDGGRDLLHARASIESGVARFECLESATGLCYWSVFPAGCDGSSGPLPVAPCASAPSRRFALATDDSRQVTGLSTARVCVAGDAAAAPACHDLGLDAR